MPRPQILCRRAHVAATEISANDRTFPRRVPADRVRNLSAFFVALGLIEERLTRSVDSACITWFIGIVPPVVWIAGNETTFGKYRAIIATGFFLCGAVAVYFYARFSKSSRDR